MNFEVKNNSSSQNILVRTYEVDTTEVPEDTSLIPPQSAIEIEAKCGVMNLEVLTESEESIWKGPVPCYVKNNIDVFPEEREVKYDGRSLPCLQKGGLLHDRRWVLIALALVMVALFLVTVFFLAPKKKIDHVVRSGSSRKN